MMSFINEALKKAQKEKDAHYIEHNGTLIAGGRGSGIPGLRFLRHFSFIAVIVILGFLAYSLLISKRDPKTKITVEKQPVSTVVQKIPEPVLNPRNDIDAEALYLRAKKLHKSGMLEEAKELYEESLKLDPGYLDSLNNLGIICINEKEYEKGKRYLEKAIRLKPAYPDPYYNLACLFSITGDTRLSINYLEKAISLDPEVKEWARRDTDLENLRGMDDFEEMLKR